MVNATPFEFERKDLMKMKEICARSGLTERAVRLYCERGLVHPDKHWDRGREYLEFSDHNLRELTVVSELRRAEFTLEEIALMLEKPETCGDVLAGWRGRVAEQNQRLSTAKDKLAELSSNDHLSAERLAELLGAKAAAHGPAPYKGETFAEFCERESQSYAYSEQMQEISIREEKRQRLGGLFLILYTVVMSLLALIDGAVIYTSTQMLLPAVIVIAVFVFLTVFLFRGAIWARVIVGARHVLSVFPTMFMITDTLPGASLGTESVTGMDGTSEVIETFMPTGLGILLTGVLVLMILLDLFCMYMLWFDRGVKEYLYDRSLRY